MRSGFNYTSNLVKSMKLQLNPVIAILLCAFVVLFPVQAAGATEISAAPPLNPDLNKSFDEEHTMATETSWTCIDLKQMTEMNGTTSRIHHWRPMTSSGIHHQHPPGTDG